MSADRCLLCAVRTVRHACMSCSGMNIDEVTVDLLFADLVLMVGESVRVVFSSH